jgi:hypothetical protein
MIGTIILLGPLALTSIILAITMIHIGIEDFFGKPQKPTTSKDDELRRYIEEVKEMMNPRSSN